MTALIIVAAGRGERLGAPVPKALVDLAGRSLLDRCLEVARTIPRISQVVVVAPAGLEEQVRVAVGATRAAVVAGAATRDGSVRAGLAAVDPPTRDVLVHDAARPLTPVEVFDRVLDALDEVTAVIPVMPVADTIKRVRDGIVVGTPARDELVAVQTPQGFRTGVLSQAHDARSGEVTDDAMLVEQLGVPVHVVAGSPRAMKVTTSFDLAVAAGMLEES
jgi:2-C-methyl-D-erythritol 4-phosphate cytidylyltransferase